MMEIDPIVVALVLVFNILVGSAIGRSKDRIGGGAILGGLLGPLGWLLVAVGPNLGRKCPACMGGVPIEATACMHCGRSL